MDPVLPFALDLNAPGPGGLARALHRQLREAILDGRLAAGAALPSTRELAAAQGVARNTVVAAYDLLVAEGYLAPRANARPRVAEAAARRPAAHADAPLLGRGRLHPRWRDPAFARELPPSLPPRSFRLGMPEHHGFPHAQWRRLAMRALRGFAREPFRYPPAQGLPELREAIAAHVAFARAVACAAGDVVVTSGTQQALDLLARLLVAPGRTRVAVEDPGYPPARLPFMAAGAELVPVPVDDEGLCVDALPADAGIIVVTPSHQSPTGAAMSLPRRRALLDHARAHDALVIEDDYDGEFRFDGRPLDALQTLDRDARVFYLGTFSKSLFPALRKGFVVAPAWAREGLLMARQVADPHGDAVAQATLAAFIRDGHLARHVRRMHRLYGGRRARLLEGLRGLDEWFEPVPGEAGLHLAVRVRREGAARTLALAARHLPGAVDVATLSLRPRAPMLAIGYGAIDADAIDPALESLRRALR
jgi:GntR family transcriptional regulator/MocR family aminotransferase